MSPSSSWTGALTGSPSCGGSRNGAWVSSSGCGATGRWRRKRGALPPGGALPGVPRPGAPAGPSLWAGRRWGSSWPREAGALVSGLWALGTGSPGYRLRVWIEEAFRDLKGRGFGLDRHGLRTEGSLRGWLWLLFLGMVLLVLLGAALRGREWWPKVVAHPERQSLFRLARLLLAQGPPPCGVWRCGRSQVFCGNGYRGGKSDERSALPPSSPLPKPRGVGPGAEAQGSQHAASPP